MTGGQSLFHADHPRRLIPELSASAHSLGWFVGVGSGGFFSIKQGDSVYVAASNVVKNRLTPDDLFVYKVNDASVAVSPNPDRKLEPCELIGLLMLIYKERKGCGAVLHSNGQDPVLASLVYTGPEFKIRNQGAIRGIYNEQLRRNYSMDEELTVPIVNVATEAAVRQAIRQNPHANAVIVRNQGMFIWAENWQKCQAMAESYHLLTGIAVQMEKLGLNVYTHDVTSADISSINTSIQSTTSTFNGGGATKAVPTPAPKPAPSQTAKAVPAAKPKPVAAAKPVVAAKPVTPAKPATTSTPAPVKANTPTASTAAAAKTPAKPAPAAATPATSAKKTPNGVNNKATPLKKTSSQRGGKVMKRGGHKGGPAAAAAAVARGGPGGRGGARGAGRGGRGGGVPGGSPGPHQIPPMMGPDPFAMGSPPMGGPPMGHPMMNPMMMGPPMGMGPGPQGPPRGGGGRGGRGGKRGGRGGAGGGGGGDKKNNAPKQHKKAGVSQNMLMNY